MEGEGEGEGEGGTCSKVLGGDRRPWLQQSSSNALSCRQHQQSCHLANGCYASKILFNTFIVIIRQFKHFL